jgi:hypothetical protein
MGIIPAIVLVLVLTGLPIHLLFTARGRFLVKFMVTKIRSLGYLLKLPHFHRQKFSRTTPSSKLPVDIKREGWRCKFGKLKSLRWRFSKNIAIAAMVLAAVIAGNSVSAQITPSPIASLKSVSVPEPDNLGDFVKDVRFVA